MHVSFIITYLVKRKPQIGVLYFFTVHRTAGGPPRLLGIDSPPTTVWATTWGARSRKFGSPVFHMYPAGSPRASPYNWPGSLGRPAVIFDHSPFGMMVSFYEPRATAFFADSDAAYCRDRRMIVLRPSVIRHKFRLYPQFTAGRLDQDVPYDIAYRRWK